MHEHKKLIQLVLSVIITALFIQLYLKKKEGMIGDAYKEIKVLVSAQDIPPRTLMHESFLAVMSVPAKYVAPGAIAAADRDTAMKKIKGMVTIGGIAEGSQVVMSNLIDPTLMGTGVAPQIPRGKRGYLLRLGNLDIQQLIIPGDYIDVLATLQVRKGESSYKISTIILQYVLVVGVGRDLQKRGEGNKAEEKNKESLAITLALGSEEAQNLALAQAESNGEISIIVRSQGDKKIHKIQPVTPGTLLR